MLRSRILGAVIALFTATSAHAQSESRLGESEVSAALTAIERRCAVDTALAISPAIRAMNEQARQAGGVEIPQTQTSDVAQAFRSLVVANPELDERLLARAAVDAMRAAVDPGSPGDGGYNDLPSCNCGAGAGVEFTQRDGQTIVVRALPNGPAARAGVQAGDHIVAIDGVSTEGWTMRRTLRALQGEPQSTIVIAIARDGAPDPIVFQLQRAIVVVGTVEARRDGEVGIISIHSFAQNTGAAVRNAIRGLRHPAAYVLDLRGNSGGLLDQAIETADLFLDGGVVVSVQSAHECPPSETATYNARRGDQTRGARLLVLIDAHTASGAELVAAALLDRGRAELVGQRSFGMGEVSTQFPLSARAGIRLITGDMTSPSGRRLSEGLEPTHVTPAATGGEDVTLQRALEILRGG